MIEVNNKYEDLRKLSDTIKKVNELENVDIFDKIIDYNSILSDLYNIVIDVHNEDDRKLKIAKVMIVDVIHLLYKAFRFELDSSVKLNKCASQGLQAYYDYLLIRIGEPLEDKKFSDDIECCFESED